MQRIIMKKKKGKWIVSNFQKTSNDAHEIFLPFKKPRESTMRIYDIEVVHKKLFYFRNYSDYILSERLKK